jgi:GMP synthase-like glutamine amidotransferase
MWGGGKMKVHVLQHVPFEGIGSMAPWLEARGGEAGYTRFYENPALPGLEGLDLVIVMGGPMSANDESELPWLRPEKQFIHEAIQRGVSVLGVCLGAQLIASALGGRVYRNPVKEIGWFPVEAAPGAAAAFRFPPTCTVFHWHGETFDLPAGAVRLARSKACENQAFQFKRNVIGLQFHLETTPQSARALIDNCSHELVPGPYIQSKSQLYAVPNEAYAEINGLMGRVLAYVTRVAG